jgi:DNA-directed RNA polymerase subunit M/transcription elongation factor TFIIS
LKKITSILVLILVVAIIGISGCTSSSNNKTTPSYSSNNTTTTQAPASTNQTSSSSVSSSSSSNKFPMVLPEGMKVSCPQCGSFNNVVTAEKEYYNGKTMYMDSFRCKNCGNKWDEPFSTPAEGTSAN